MPKTLTKVDQYGRLDAALEYSRTYRSMLLEIASKKNDRLTTISKYLSIYPLPRAELFQKIENIKKELREQERDKKWRIKKQIEISFWQFCLEEKQTRKLQSEKKRLEEKITREGRKKAKKKFLQLYYKEFPELMEKDLKYNLVRRIMGGMRNSLKQPRKISITRSWEKLVGFTVSQLYVHLKKTMPKGFTWLDFFSGDLHIDHIFPVSAFNFTKFNHLDFQRCWTLKNLRLFPAKKNISKGAKLPAPFQKTFAVEIPVKEIKSSAQDRKTS